MEEIKGKERGVYCTRN